jgi:hypothetical protein
MTQIDIILDRWNNKLNSLFDRFPKMNQSIYVLGLYGGMFLMLANFDTF